MYSGLLGAYLESSSSIPSEIPPWFDNSLTNAINWLKEHNPYINQYSQMILPLLNTNPRLPVATHSIIDENTPPFQRGDIVVPHQNFPTEVHDEDANYRHLIAGFITNDDINKIPIALNNPHLEPLLFPDLYPDGHGHYYEM